MHPILVLAIFLSITDADTFVIAYRAATFGQGSPKAIWLEQSVRLYGIDTPESFRPKCLYEKNLAKQAKQAVQKLLINQIGYVYIHPETDKYGRTLASVFTSDRVDVGGELMKRGLARSYFGKKKQSWCK